MRFTQMAIGLLGTMLTANATEVDSERMLRPPRGALQGKLIKTEKKNGMICKTYQKGNMRSTRCESKASTQIPSGAKVIRKTTKKGRTCTTFAVFLLGLDKFSLEGS